MLNIPKPVRELFKQNSVRKNFRVHFPNGECTDLTNADLISESVTLTESICSQEDLQLGMVETPTLQFECVNKGNFKSAEIEASIEIDVEDLIEQHIPIGSGVLTTEHFSVYDKPIVWNPSTRREISLETLNKDITDLNNSSNRIILHLELPPYYATKVIDRKRVTITVLPKLFYYVSDYSRGICRIPSGYCTKGNPAGWKTVSISAQGREYLSTLLTSLTDIDTPTDVGGIPIVYWHWNDYPNGNVTVGIELYSNVYPGGYDNEIQNTIPSTATTYTYTVTDSTTETKKTYVDTYGVRLAGYNHTFYDSSETGNMSHIVKCEVETFTRTDDSNQMTGNYWKLSPYPEIPYHIDNLSKGDTIVVSVRGVEYPPSTTTTYTNNTFCFNTKQCSYVYRTSKVGDPYIHVTDTDGNISDYYFSEVGTINKLYNNRSIPSTIRGRYSISMFTLTMPTDGDIDFTVYLYRGTYIQVDITRYDSTVKYDGKVVTPQESGLSYTTYRIPYGTFIVDECSRSASNMYKRKVTAYSKCTSNYGGINIESGVPQWISSINKLSTTSSALSLTVPMNLLAELALKQPDMYNYEYTWGIPTNVKTLNMYLPDDTTSSGRFTPPIIGQVDVTYVATTTSTTGYNSTLSWTGVIGKWKHSAEYVKKVRNIIHEMVVYNGWSDTVETDLILMCTGMSIGGTAGFSSFRYRTSTGCYHTHQTYPDYVITYTNSGSYKYVNPVVFTRQVPLSKVSSSYINIYSYDSETKKSTYKVIPNPYHIIPYNRGEDGYDIGMSVTNFGYNRVFTNSDTVYDADYIRLLELSSEELIPSGMKKSSTGGSTPATGTAQSVTFLKEYLPPEYEDDVVITDGGVELMVASSRKWVGDLDPMILRIQLNKQISNTIAGTTTKRTEYTVNEKYLNDLNLRNFVGSQYELNGSIGRITRNGILHEFKLYSALGLYPSELLIPREDLYPQDGGDIVDTSIYKSLWYDDYQSPKYRYVLVKDDDTGTLTYPEFDTEYDILGMNEASYNLSGNYFLNTNNLTFTDTELLKFGKQVYEALEHIQYMPAEIKMVGLPYLEVGDWIEVLTNDGGFQTLVKRRTLKGIQSLTDTIES